MANLRIEYINPKEITPYARNARIHDDRHVRQIADSITQFDFTNPLLIDENNVLLAGHGRLLAAKKLGMDSVPCVRIDHLSDAQKRAYRIADNQLTIAGDWDRDLLGLEFKELDELDLDFPLDITGFDLKDIDVLIQGDVREDTSDGADAIPDMADGVIVSRLGDLWQLGNHIIYCGDALQRDSFNALFADGVRARMIFADASYNVPVNGHVCGAYSSLRIRHGIW